jgi:cytochrome c
MSETGKDGLLLNKVMAGFLTAGIVLWGANRIASVVIHTEAPEKTAITIAGMQTAMAPAPAAGLASIIALVGSADVSKGAAFVQQQCSSCHTLSQGGAAGVGPNLYGVVGGPMFAGSFAYSDAVKAKAKGNWNYDNMNAWLADPTSYAPGTAMSYSGIKNTQTRADVVAYLRTLSASPLPLPTPAEVAAANAPAPATASTGSAPPSGPAPSAGAPDIGTLFAAADISKGQALVQQQCSSCHNVDKGGAASVGPDLYGIVGAKMFAQAGFSYSDAVKAKANGNWTPETLSDWLKDPMGFAPGTAMAYPGIKNDQTRADVIAYLNKNSDSPLSLPGAK